MLYANFILSEIASLVFLCAQFIIHYICKTAVGNYVLIKRENFASDEDFYKCKVLSDEDYHLEKNATQRSKHKNVMLSEKLDNEICCLSAEDVFCEKLYSLERIDKVCRIKNLLPQTQYRRLLLYGVRDISIPKIAKMEGVGTSCVFSSIYGDRKKIKKRLSEFVE